MTQLDKPQKAPLHQAARLGNIAEMEKLLSEGADINAYADISFDSGINLYQVTPLMVAAWSIDGASVETLHYLVERGADVSIKGGWGNTAAWYAAGNCGLWESQPRLFIPDYTLRLEYLLDAGLEAYEGLTNGEYLLLEACHIGDSSRVELLLKRFPSREISNNSLYSRLLYSAAQSGCSECVRLLLLAGADPKMQDMEGRTALMYAGSAKVAKLLIDSGSNIYATDKDDCDVLQTFLDARWFVAGAAERFEIIRLLVSFGVDIERCDKYGWNSLHSVAFRYDSQAVEFLLNLGANPHAVDKYGRTALHKACWMGDAQSYAQINEDVVRTIKLLVSFGLDVNARDTKDNTPMHEAASGDWGSLSAISTLLKHGANPDPVGQDGITPLMLAASRSEVECVRALLLANANPRKVNHQGLCAIDYARENYECWLNINQQPADTDIEPNQDDDDVKSTHQLALQEATECFNLLLEKELKI